MAGLEAAFAAAREPLTEEQREIALLREALLPFALASLTREAKNIPDDAPVTFTMAQCRAAQKAMAAD